LDRFNILLGHKPKKKSKEKPVEKLVQAIPVAPLVDVKLTEPETVPGWPDRIVQPAPSPPRQVREGGSKKFSGLAGFAIFIIIVALSYIGIPRSKQAESKPVPAVAAKDIHDPEITVDKPSMVIREYTNSMIEFGKQEGYFEGQKDAMTHKICIGMRDSQWVWIKNPWDSTFSKKIDYQPQIGHWKSLCKMAKDLKGVTVK
jgi:hypothetical protein